MTLEEYRLENNLSYKKLAEKLGFKEATIARRWCLPKAHQQSLTPSSRNLGLILEVTMGSVTPNDFIIRRN
jgi:transcriptional regulator with XRE-family HTH domain